MGKILEYRDYNKAMLADFMFQLIIKQFMPICSWRLFDVSLLSQMKFP